jgi:acetylornithine deacetylase/succinyl-diaminopimelate desuccinylase-like protein
MAENDRSGRVLSTHAGRISVNNATGSLMIPQTRLTVASPQIQAALDFIDSTDDQTVEDMIELTKVPAPSGSERERGEWFANRMRAAGLDVAYPDAVGNVRARTCGDLPSVMLVSHLDTVFAAHVPLTVTLADGRIYAPGISDNGRGVATLIRVAAALKHAGIETTRAIEFIASVGEEGAGDLRGVKHIFACDERPHCFIAVDGAGLGRIVHRAVGSRRFRIHVKGPGGHSWIDRGIAHPVHALSRAIAAVSFIANIPESSLSVGQIGGGIGINVIPTIASADVDIRSEDGREIARIETAMREAVRSAVDEANAARKGGSQALTFDIVSIGDRPGGATDESQDVVRHAMLITQSLGTEAELVSSSTDANVPISLGVPAIAIGAGGDAGGMHTTGEWYSNENGALGVKRVLLLALALAGMAQG